MFGTFLFRYVQYGLKPLLILRVAYRNNSNLLQNYCRCGWDCDALKFLTNVVLSRIFHNAESIKKEPFLPDLFSEHEADSIYK